MSCSTSEPKTGARAPVDDQLKLGALAQYCVSCSGASR